MKFHSQQPDFQFDVTLDRAADGLADSVLAGLSVGASEALGDPIVQALMAADKVDRSCLEAMLRCMAARITDPKHAA